MGNLINLNYATWRIIVHCKNPICIRELEPVSALNGEQALILATEYTVKLFGKQGENWDHLDLIPIT